MRLPSGVVDQYIYFVAVDSTDFATRETGLSSFTVYRSRDGGAAAAMTTPTINETDATNMPGVYELLVDEDTTIAAGNDSEEMVLHITHAGMAPVTRTIELYRPKITAGNTLDVTSTGAAGIDWGNVENPTTTVDLSATSINLCDTVTTNTDMRGTDSALLAASAPTNFGDMAITVTTGQVTVGTNNDKTGYSISGTKTTLDALNDVSTADVNAQCDTAISDAALATAAALATVDSNVDAILVDTGTTLETHLTDIKGATFSGATDSLEAIRDRGDAAWTTGAGGTPPQLLQNTTIATLSTQTSFTLTAGSADNDAYNGAVVVVTDQSTSTQKAVGSVSDYVGSTKTITLSADPGIFTMAVGDTIDIIANASTAPSAAAVRAEIDANSTQLAAIVADTNELQTDWANGGRLDLILDARASQASVDGLNDIAATDIVSNGAITTLAGAVVNVDLVDTCTTNTDMRGTDSAYTGTPPTAASIADAVLDEALSGHTTAGTLGKAVADIEIDATAILADTADMQPKLGTPSADLSADIAAVKSDTAAILIDTNELQGDWTNGGRLDLIIDAILSDTGTDGVVLTAAERNAIADAILDRNMATGTDSGSPTVRTVRQALRFSRNKVSISGGTLTVTKEDDTTASWTASVTTTAGDPITTVDPA